MESFLQVIIVLGAIVIMVARSYRKTKNAPRPVIDPAETYSPVETPPPAPFIEPVAPAPVAVEDLPPIPPLARQREVPVKEEEDEKKTEERENNVNPVLGMDLRQAVIASEILNRKY